MRRSYIGKIKELNKIIISDPSYGKKGDMRFEKTFNNNQNLDVQMNINDVDEILFYEKEKYHARGIEFSILIKKPECIDISIDTSNNLHCEPDKYEKMNKVEIAMDSSCIALGINKHADMITDSKDDWQPGCALKTGTDGVFGEVKEIVNGNETQCIVIYGYLDEDMDYSYKDIKNYLVNNFEIDDLFLEKEIDEEKEYHRVIYKEPGKEAEVMKIGKDLKSEQEVVGGLIETVPFTEHTILVCNEEGKLDGLLPNIKYGNFDVIAGNFFIIGNNEENCDFRSLTDEEIDECMEKIEELSFELNEEQEMQ